MPNCTNRSFILSSLNMASTSFSQRCFSSFVMASPGWIRPDSILVAIFSATTSWDLFVVVGNTGCGTLPTVIVVRFRRSPTGIDAAEPPTAVSSLAPLALELLVTVAVESHDVRTRSRSTSSLFDEGGNVPALFVIATTRGLAEGIELDVGREVLAGIEIGFRIVVVVVGGEPTRGARGVVVAMEGYGLLAVYGPFFGRGRFEDVNRFGGVAPEPFACGGAKSDLLGRTGGFDVETSSAEEGRRAGGSGNCCENVCFASSGEGSAEDAVDACAISSGRSDIFGRREGVGAVDVVVGTRGVGIAEGGGVSRVRGPRGEIGGTGEGV